MPDKHKTVWRLSINKCLHEHESMHISSCAVLPFWNTARILKEMRHLPFALPLRHSRHQIYQRWGNEAHNIQKWRVTVRTCSLKNIVQQNQNANGLKWNLLELSLLIPVIAVGLQKRRYKTYKSAVCSLDFVSSNSMSPKSSLLPLLPSYWFHLVRAKNKQTKKIERKKQDEIQTKLTKQTHHRRIFFHNFGSRVSAHQEQNEQRSLWLRWNRLYSCKGSKMRNSVLCEQFPGLYKLCTAQNTLQRDYILHETLHKTKRAPGEFSGLLI